MKYMPEYIRQAYPKPPEQTDYAKMAQLCNDSLTEHPEDRDYLLAYRAVYLGYCGKHKEAVELCNKYLSTLKIDDCIDDMKDCLVHNLKQTGDIPAAIKALQDRAETEVENRGHLYDDIRELYTTLKDTDNIIKYCLLMIEQGPVDTEVLTQLANAYDDKRDYPNSHKYFEEAARNGNDETSWLWNNAGRALGLSGQTEEAMFYFKMVLKLNPRSEMAHYYLGHSYQTLGDVYRALHHYTEALKIRPAFAEVYNNMARLSFTEDSDIQAAIQHLEKALEANPDKSTQTLVYINLSRLYKMIADYDRHNYYQAKVMEAAGFGTDFTSEEDDEDEIDEV